MVLVGNSVKVKRGTATKIAKKFDLTVNHVWLCIQGERVGSPKLMRAIAKEVERQREADKAA